MSCLLQSFFVHCLCLLPYFLNDCFILFLGASGKSKERRPHRYGGIRRWPYMGCCCPPLRLAAAAAAAAAAVGVPQQQQTQF